MGKILQINMNYGIDAEVLAKAFMELAQPIADVEGLKWKVWIHNAEEKSCGGIYLFKDEASVKGYLDGEIVAGIAANPALSNISLKVFDVLPDHSKVTRAPL
ncbi:MAG: YdhR family protein [Candidatus Hodarchaeales archaeon]|jgi:hypothetical protein